jgi:hypothetical protein
MLREECVLMRHQETRLPKGAVEHRATHRDTFTSLHAISKRRLLVAHASAYLAFVATRSDFLPAFGAVCVCGACRSKAPPLRQARNSAAVHAATRVGLMSSHSFALFILLCIGINWAFKSYGVRNRMQKLISLI